MKPFRPSNPPKKGRGYFGTFRWEGQEYKEDPEKEKWAKQVAERKAARESESHLHAWCEYVGNIFGMFC